MPKNSIEFLKDKIGLIKSALSKEIIDNPDKYLYTNFGTSIEPFMNDLLKPLIEGENFGKVNLAPNKNHFPDLTILEKNKKALDYKVGNHSVKKGNNWGTTKNSNNDLGTFNSFNDHISTFDGENIYFLFIEYNFTDSVKEIIDVKIDNFYKFVGVSPDGLIRYREKDGNMRPKDFNSPPIYNSFNDFNKLVEKTIIKRSQNIISKHKDILGKDEFDLYMSKLGYSKKDN